MSPFAIVSFAILAVIVIYLIMYGLNSFLIFRKYTGNLSQASTYEFRNKVKQPFQEQDV
jgi:hypothetical protein